MVGSSAIAKRGAGLAAAICAVALAAACSSAASRPEPPKKAVSTAKPTASSVLAAAPAAILAAKTMALDETGASGGQTLHITGEFDYGATFKAAMNSTVTGGKPADPAYTIPTLEGAVVDGSRYYEPVAEYAGASSAAVVKALNGKVWILGQFQDASMAATRLRTYLMAGMAAASDDYLRNALAALLSSGILVPDAAPGPGGTFHYTGTLDDAKRQTAKFTDAQRQNIADDMTTRNVMAEKIDIWLAPDGLPTELTFSETATNAHADPPMSGDVHFTWAKPVSVTVPDASDVTTMQDVSQAVRNLGSGMTPAHQG